MTLQSQLFERAKQIAEIQRAQYLQLHSEMTAIQKASKQPWHADRLKFLRVQAGNCAAAVDRLNTYDTGRPGKDDPDCPFCWLINEIHSPVKTVSSPDTQTDHFRCRECEELYAVDQT